MLPQMLLNTQAAKGDDVGLHNQNLQRIKPFNIALQPPASAAKLVGCKRWLGAANSTPAPFPGFCTPSSNCDRSSVRPGVSRHLQPASICLSPQGRVDKTPYQ